MGGRVVVVGALHVDRRLVVDTLPRPGETVHSRSSVVGPGGKGLNQAVAAASAGAATILVGAVGADAAADVVLSALSRHGMQSGSVARIEGVPTGGAVVLVDAAAENVIVIESGANAAQQPAAAVTAMGSVTAEDVLVLQNELPVPVSRAAAARAKAAGARVLWNAAPAPTGLDEVLEDVDVVLCNEHECARICVLLGLPVESPQRAAAAIATRLHAAVVCTLGAAGAVVAADREAVQVPAPTVAALDTTGAGDTFAGYLAAGLQAGLGLKSAAQVAVAAGALAVTRAGAADAIPTNDAVRAFLDQTR